MDWKRLGTSLLFGLALFLLFNMYFRGGGGAPAPKPAVFSAYTHITPFKTPEDDKTRPAEAGETPQSVVLGNIGPGSKDKLALTVTNVTAAVDLVQLNPNDYSQSVGKKDPLTFFRGVANSPRPFATIGVHLKMWEKPPYPGAKNIAIEAPFSGRLDTIVADHALDLDAAARTRKLSADEQSDLDLTRKVLANAGGKNIEALMGDLVNRLRTRALSSDEEKELAQIQRFVAEANATNMLDNQYVWKIEDTTPTRVTMSVLFTYGPDKQPLAKVLKTFEINPASYEITVTHTVENRSGHDIDASIDQLGAPELLRDDPASDDRFYMGVRLNSAGAYVDGSHPLNFAHQLFEHSMAGWKDSYTGAYHDVGTIDVGQMSDYGKDPVLWLSDSNRFFTVIERPLPESTAGAVLKINGGTDLIYEAHHIEHASVDLTSAGLAASDDTSIVRLQGKAFTLPAAAAGAAPSTIAEPISVYLGPKKDEILEGITASAGGDLAKFARDPRYQMHVYQYVKVIQFNLCWAYSFCVVDWLVFAIVKLLTFLANTIAFHNYGIAIMVLVIVVRLLLHPLTRSGQINMAKMGRQMADVKPKIDAMKKRYEGDSKRQNEEMMRIYRENNINPAAPVMGCLPMMLQLPIWAALLSGLRVDIDLRHASFIPGWINDLANPDTVWPVGGVVLGHPLFTIPLFNFPIYGLNPLPILLAVILFLNMKVMSATQPKPADDQQAQMQKWSQYTIFILPFFLYNAPSGSNLYFFASTVGGLIDTYFIRKALKKRGILPASAKDLPLEDKA